MYSTIEDCARQENEISLQIIIYIEDEQIIIGIIKISALEEKVSRQILKRLVSKEHNEIKYKKSKHIKTENHNYKLTNLNKQRDMNE